MTYIQIVRCLVGLILAAGVFAGFAAPTVAQRPASAPRRIVSLVPAVTEMLFAIGAGDRTVAVSSFDRFPPEVAKLPRVGALLDPDVERILALRPDLVIVYRTQHDLRTQLERAGIPLFSYEHAGLADVTTTLRAIGERVGSPDRAAPLATSIEQRIEAVRKRTGSGARPRTLVIMGRDPFTLRGMFASGGVGFIHDMLSAAGGDNVFADVQRQAVQATSELIIARRPEIIVELRAEPVDRRTIEQEIKAWAALPSIPAVRDRRVHIVGDARTIIPGPRVAEGIELLADIVQLQR